MKGLSSVILSSVYIIILVTLTSEDDEGSCRANSKTHLIEDKRDLNTATNNIGNWILLCQYLNASDSVMNGLEYSKDQDSNKRFKCLTDVYNNQSPDWETVVGVVGNIPISDQREACKIAKKYIGMGETECRCIISAHVSSKDDVKGNKTVSLSDEASTPQINGTLSTPSLPKPENEESLRDNKPESASLNGDPFFWLAIPIFRAVISIIAVISIVAVIYYLWEKAGGNGPKSIYQKYVSSIPASNRYKLRNKLDFEHGYLDVHLVEIANSMINWREKLATPLGLTAVDVHTITSDNQNQAILQQREALRLWKNKNGSIATYDRLLRIFVNAGRNDCADILCKLLGADTDQEQYKKYLQIIENNLSLEIKILRLIHLGLPRSGKTTTQLRLFEEILNLHEDGRKFQCSTKLAEIRHLFIGLMESNKWRISKNMQEEADLLSKLLSMITENTTSPSDKYRDFSSLISACMQAIIDLLTSSESLATNSEDSNSPPSNSKTREDMKTLFDSLQKGESNKNWDEFNNLLEDTLMLLNADTGGQAELLNMLAPLIMGPSLYLIYHRLIDPLDKEYFERATDENGVDTEEEDSAITVEDFLFQVLASITCFSNRTEKASSRSKAMLVGTFRDKMPNDEDLKEKDKLLQAKLSTTQFIKDGTIEYAHKDQLLLDVNNRYGDKADLDRFRGAIERAIERSFARIRIPASWLMLSLAIRLKRVSTVPLKECEELAWEFNIDHKELQSALWFFHRIMGIFLYYPDLEELKDIVICDVKVVFDSVYELIKNTFGFTKAGKIDAEKFKETAQFSQKTLDSAVYKQSDSLLSLPRLVKLLKHLNILTTLPSTTPDVIYFMPCLLRSAKADELKISENTSFPASLMLQFECDYVPLGIFPGMITNMASQRLEHWDLNNESFRKKNKIEFRVGEDNDVVTLILRPKYIEIVVSRKSLPVACSDRMIDSSPPSLSTFHPICVRVREAIKSTLLEVTSRINKDFNQKYKFAFKCPAHPDSDHLCTLDSETDKSMKCQENPRDCPRIPLKGREKVWFDYPSACVLV